MQYLTMPFQKQMMQIGYKAAGYRAYWGYHHYGVDVSAHCAGGDRTVLASGDGEVVLTGRDSAVGNVVAVVYPDVFLRATGESRALTARYMHLASVAVGTGQKVRRGDVLGVEGNTGTKDLHLHLELDTDIQYPAYSPQVAGGTLIRKGVDTTVNPSEALYLGEGQSLVAPTYNPAWLNPEDRSIPGLPDAGPTLSEQLERALTEAARLRALVAQYEAERAGTGEPDGQITERMR